MAREGMDVDVITSDGNQMRDVGQNAIPSLISAVDGIVADLHGNWHGQDADSFVQAWQGQFKPALDTIAGEVAKHGQLAVTNAQEQQSASSGTTIA